jgi:hypothetical protein
LYNAGIGEPKWRGKVEHESALSDIEKMNTRLITLQNQFLHSGISPQDYHIMKQRVEKDLIGLELKLKDLKEDRSPYKEYINQTVPMLENRWSITENLMVRPKRRY